MPRVVKLFISYPSDQRELAERLRLALEEERHAVFTDRSELREGEAYHAALREAIADADAMIYLITPRSVAPGSYALTELDLAQRQWRIPAGRVLPVLVEPTPIATVPAYLRSVTLLQPRGDVVAETVAAVARLHGSARRVWWAGAGALVLVAAAAGAWWHLAQREQERLARQQLLEAETAAAARLCSIGNHAIAWDQFALVAARFPDDPVLRVAREDCGMRWLREMRVRSDKETFTEFVARAQPVLAQGLGRSSGARRADLQAHLGWGDFLRGREGGGAPEAVPQFRAALQDDPGNVYALAMWAHQGAWRGEALEGIAGRFATALKSPREREWVRSMQFAAAFLQRRYNEYALLVADDMRRQGETASRTARDTIWRSIFVSSFMNPPERRAVLQTLPPPDLLNTFVWLYPQAKLDEERRPTWRYLRAMLMGNAGDGAGARKELEQLDRELTAAKEDSRVSRAVRQALVELRAG
jgi:hypothetical protein